MSYRKDVRDFSDDAESWALEPEKAPPIERARVRGDRLVLTEKRAEFKLEPGCDAKGNRAPSISEAVRSLGAGRKLFLIVRDLRTNVQPGVIYNLYLDLPPKTSPQIAKEYFVGTINFFNASVASNPAKATNSERFFSFDVTQLLKSLDASHKLAKALILAIIPGATPKSAANPQIGEIILLEQ